MGDPTIGSDPTLGDPAIGGNPTMGDHTISDPTIGADPTIGGDPTLSDPTMGYPTIGGDSTMGDPTLSDPTIRGDPTIGGYPTLGDPTMRETHTWLSFLCILGWHGGFGVPVGTIRGQAVCPWPEHGAPSVCCLQVKPHKSLPIWRHQHWGLEGWPCSVQ